VPIRRYLARPLHSVGLSGLVNRCEIEHIASTPTSG
jgi:hypothetical protein